MEIPVKSPQTYNFENNIFLIKNVNQVDLVIRTEIRVDYSTKNEDNWAGYNVYNSMFKS